MSPEEYNRIKEAEKEHLRKLKKIKQTTHTMRRQQSVNQAIGALVNSHDDVMGVHDEMLDKVSLETVKHEARLDMALESAAEKEAEVQAQREKETFEADQQKARAQELIAQMKLEMGLSGRKQRTPAPPTSEAAPDTGVEEKPENPPESADPRPEKTIGRMKP